MFKSTIWLVLLGVFTAAYGYNSTQYCMQLVPTTRWSYKLRDLETIGENAFAPYFMGKVFMFVGIHVFSLFKYSSTFSAAIFMNIDITKYIYIKIVN